MNAMIHRNWLDTFELVENSMSDNEFKTVRVVDVIPLLRTVFFVLVCSLSGEGGGR